MSEALTTVVEDVYHMNQASYLLEHIDLSLSPFVFTQPRDERLEFSTVESPFGGLATVIRQRHNSIIDGHREDVYFGFRPEQSDPNWALSILTDSLELETQWVAAGEFDKVKPRHDALARKVAAGTGTEVRLADHDNIREFLRLLHQTISEQKRLREAS